jgi:hypothetical protein
MSRRQRPHGGKCKVNWTRTALRKEYGGPRILDLNKFAMALGLRWLLHEWASPGKKLGSDPNYHATNKTDFFSLHAQRLPWGRKKNIPVLELAPGGEDPKTLHRSYKPK